MKQFIIIACILFVSVIFSSGCAKKAEERLLSDLEKKVEQIPALLGYITEAADRASVSVTDSGIIYPEKPQNPLRTTQISAFRYICLEDKFVLCKFAGYELKGRDSAAKNTFSLKLKVQQTIYRRDINMSGEPCFVLLTPELAADSKAYASMLDRLVEGTESLESLERRAIEKLKKKAWSVQSDEILEEDCLAVWNPEKKIWIINGVELRNLAPVQSILPAPVSEESSETYEYNGELLSSREILEKEQSANGMIRFKNGWRFKTPDTDDLSAPKLDVHGKLKSSEQVSPTADNHKSVGNDAYNQRTQLRYKYGYLNPNPVFRDIQLQDGSQYKHVRILFVAPDGLDVEHEKGVRFVPFKNLPDDICNEFWYDEVKAAEFVSKLKGGRSVTNSDNKIQTYEAADMAQVAKVLESKKEPKIVAQNKTAPLALYPAMADYKITELMSKADFETKSKIIGQKIIVTGFVSRSLKNSENGRILELLNGRVICSPADPEDADFTAINAQILSMKRQEVNKSERFFKGYVKTSVCGVIANGSKPGSIRLKNASIIEWHCLIAEIPGNAYRLEFYIKEGKTSPIMDYTPIVERINVNGTLYQSSETIEGRRLLLDKRTAIFMDSDPLSLLTEAHILNNTMAAKGYRNCLDISLQASLKNPDSNSTAQVYQSGIITYWSSRSPEVLIPRLSSYPLEKQPPMNLLKAETISSHQSFSNRSQINKSEVHAEQ